MVRITLNQRRKWLRVAEQAAKTINNISTNIDEQEIYIQLDKLARLVNEANTKAENGKPMKLGKQKGQKTPHSTLTRHTKH
jgi:methionyl-tRNA synthetase